jgi:hypothetical protein
MDHIVTARLHTVEMLEDLLAVGRTVLINIGPEGEYQGSADRRSSRAITLEDCVEQLTDHPRMKVCLRADCLTRPGQPISLSNFGNDNDSRDGRSSVCRKCEAKRIGGIGKQRKQKEKAGGHAGQVGVVVAREDDGHH